MTRMILMLGSAMLLTVGACNREAAPPANEDVAAMNEAATANSIDGTWKFDLARTQVVEEEPDAILLKDGSYSCTTCVPPLTVAADGAFHPVADRPYFDSMSMTIVDANTVKTVRKKGDRVTGETTRTVAPDGKTMTVSFVNSATEGVAPVTGKRTETRVAAGPAGAHAISGTWKTASMDAMSDEGRLVTFGLDGDTLTMSGGGESYAAKLDGTETPIKGDIGGTIVSVERVSDNVFRETYKRDGKLLSVNTLTVADGKLSVLSEDKVQKGSARYTATRQ